MPKIKNLVTEVKEPTLRRNPEIDAKLEKFIQENPRAREYFEALPKEELIRKLMLAKMQQQDYRETRNESLKAWVEEHPEIKERIEERIRHVPASNREYAFINAARREAESHGMKPNAVRASVS